MSATSNIILPDISKAILKMAYPSEKYQLPTSGLVLAADLGGTKTELALFQIKDHQLVLLKNQRYPTGSHQMFVEAIKDFDNDKSLNIDSVCLAVAGVINGDKVRGVNFSWEIDANKIKTDLGIKKVHLINDLRANAYGLAGLKDSDFELIHKGEIAEGNAAIISPGTGLGEAGLYWDGNAYHPYATEGGHCSFSPSDELDLEIWKFLHTKFEHISWERLVSGQGIMNTYDFLVKYRQHIEPEWITNQFKTEDKAAVISQSAIEKKDSVCIETMELFLKYLAKESAQLALKAKSNGGIFIGGGIVPKILTLIDKEVFIKNFINDGRMESLLKSIPIKVVLNDKTALMGAAYYAAMQI